MKKLLVLILAVIAFSTANSQTIPTPVTPGGTITKRLYTVKIVGIDTSTFPYQYTGIIQIDSQLKFLTDGSVMSRAPYTKAQVDSLVAIAGSTPTLQQVLNQGNTSTTGFLVNASSAVGTTTADTKAVLTINSTTKGVLLPRMTITQMLAITTPTAGLQVMVIPNYTVWLYNGTNWIEN